MFNLRIMMHKICHFSTEPHAFPQAVEKCKQMGEKNGKYYYISLDMLKKESPKQLIEVKLI